MSAGEGSSDLKSGELFAGVGGLGMAVDSVFGSSPAWFAEFDRAPSRVLAHRYPGVPNFGDVTTVVDPPRVDILAGGFPCQDVSLAGRRRGMRDGTRSGLWSEFARLIDTIRPDWVVIENVRGLLSADASGGDMEPCPWCVGDDGEQHALRALGAVLGDLAELGFDAEWVGLPASDVGAPHGRFRVFILAWPAERTLADSGGGRGRRGAVASGRGEGTGADASADGADPRAHGASRAAELRLLPTPVASSGSHGGPNRTYGDGSPTLDGIQKLLPTPSAGVHNDGEDVDNWLARRERVKATGVNGNGMGMPLPIAVQLLPTPRTTDMNGPGLHGDGGMDLRTAATLLFPTPMVGSTSPAAHGQISGDFRAAMDRALSRIAVAESTDWGPYTAAVERWGSIVGRPAPSPVRFDGKGGKARLNPELPEWMMGWPAGWVTDPAIGLSRSEQLKACGNGVVPQQAAYALRLLLARSGVPALRLAA